MTIGKSGTATLAASPLPLGSANRGISPSAFARALPRLLVLALACAIGFTLSGSFGTLQEAAKAELGLSDVQLGLIQGVGAAVPMVLFSIPIGIAVDRWNRVRLLIGFALISIAGTLATGFGQGVGTLFVARMTTGIGMAGGLTAALSIAADLCAPEQRGRAVLIVNVGKSAGLAGGFALTGLLFGTLAQGGMLGSIPWRAAHLALALCGALAIVPLLLLREPARQESEAGPDAPFRVVTRELWARRRFLVPLFVGQVSVVMADAAALIWATPVLTRSHGLSPQDFSAWIGALLLGTGVAGAVIGGLVADLGQRSGRRGGLLIGAVVAAVIGVPAALFPLSPSVPLFALAFGTQALAGGVTALITSVALTVYLPNELRGLCIGAFIALAGLVGFGLAPPLVGWLSGQLGGERFLAVSLAGVGTTTSVIAVFAFWLAIRRAPNTTKAI